MTCNMSRTLCACKQDDSCVRCGWWDCYDKSVIVQSDAIKTTRQCDWLQSPDFFWEIYKQEGALGETDFGLYKQIKVRMVSMEVNWFLMVTRNEYITSKTVMSPVVELSLCFVLCSLAVFLSPTQFISQTLPDWSMLVPSANHSSVLLLTTNRQPPPMRTKAAGFNAPRELSPQQLCVSSPRLCVFVCLCFEFWVLRERCTFVRVFWSEFVHNLPLCHRICLFLFVPTLSVCFPLQGTRG